MAIFTASYFEPANHHGKLVSISRSKPKGIAVQERLALLAPSQKLLDDWKAESIDQEEYTNRYRQELGPKLHKFRSWISTVDPGEDITLLCWEKAGEFCHRNLAIKLVEKYRPEIFGGCDVPKNQAKTKPQSEPIALDGTCPTCRVELVPGLDRSFCRACRVWLRTAGCSRNSVSDR